MLTALFGAFGGRLSSLVLRTSLLMRGMASILPLRLRAYHVVAATTTSAPASRPEAIRRWCRRHCQTASPSRASTPTISIQTAASMWPWRFSHPRRTTYATAPAATAVGRTQGLVNHGLVIVLLVMDLRICCGIRRLDEVDVRFSCWRALSTEVFVVPALQNQGWRR